MTTFGAWFLAGVSLVVVLVVLEGKRQERIYGKASGRQDLLGAGMLELQKHLQPDRKVEVLAEERADVEADESGDRERPGPPVRRG